MEIPPIEGKPVRFPPGKVEIRLGPEHRRAYRRLYNHYQSIVAGLPVLRERDFDGRAVRVSRAQLDALNRAFAKLQATPAGDSTAFGAQDHARRRLFKRLQFLS
jgi:hypothetical protein